MFSVLCLKSYAMHRFTIIYLNPNIYRNYHFKSLRNHTITNRHVVHLSRAYSMLISRINVAMGCRIRPCTVMSFFVACLILNLLSMIFICFQNHTSSLPFATNSIKHRVCRVHDSTTSRLMRGFL